MSQDSLVLGNESIPNTGRVRDVHFWFVLHLGPEHLILSVIRGVRCGNILFLIVNTGYLWHCGFVERKLFLVAEGVQPGLFWLNVISDDVVRSLSHVFFSELQASLDLYFFHVATVLRLSVDVGSVFVYSFLGVKLG